MFYILDLSFLLLSAIEFLRNSAIQVKFIINLLLFWCIYSRFSIFCLNVSCFLKLLAQLNLIRHVYNNPERRKRATIVCFMKNILQGACADVFTRPTLLGFHANGRKNVALRFAGHRAIEMLGLVGPRV